MTEPLPDTFESRDLPVLRAVVTGVDRDTEFSGVSLQQLVDATGLPQEDVISAVRALTGDHLIEQLPHSWGESIRRISNVSGRARELAGSWPTPETALDRMIQALEMIAANTDEDQDTRTRAQRIRDLIGNASGTIGIALATAALGGQLH
ncbi:MAG: hypothetical protein QOI06_233 [Nocardioidaceae bacterium]|jgi:hypothetical protein|nr:hypothetical protein [Nocardioidaceae bacterium]